MVKVCVEEKCVLRVVVVGDEAFNREDGPPKRASGSMFRSGASLDWAEEGR
jgi:hypothetical protein